jgi:MFS family permease
MLAIRLFDGTMHSAGVFGALKTLIAEASDDSNQPKLMSYLSTGWGLGAVIGPILGTSTLYHYTIISSGIYYLFINYFK